MSLNEPHIRRNMAQYGTVISRSYAHANDMGRDTVGKLPHANGMGRAAVDILPHANRMGRDTFGILPHANDMGRDTVDITPLPTAWGGMRSGNCPMPMVWDGIWLIFRPCQPYGTRCGRETAPYHRETAPYGGNFVSFHPNRCYSVAARRGSQIQRFCRAKGAKAAKSVGLESL